MVLPVLLHDLGQEDIVVGAVLVEAVKVQLARLLGTLLADGVRSLAPLKLGDQLAHIGFGLAHILAVAVHVQIACAAGCDVLVECVHQIVGRDDLLPVVIQRRDRDRGVDILVATVCGKATGVGRDLLQHLVHLRSLSGLGLAATVSGTGRGLDLLHRLLHHRVIVDHLRQLKRILIGLHAVSRVHDLLLHGIELHRDETEHAPLVVDVEPGEELGFGQVRLLEAEQVKVRDLLVAQEEVAAGAGELVLHQLLNADIFDDVRDALKERDVVSLRLRDLEQLVAALVGGPQGVADLVRHEHGLHRFGNLPHGHDEVAVLHIEACRLCVGIEGERNVFGGECAGEDGERGVHVRIVSSIRSLSSISGGRGSGNPLPPPRTASDGDRGNQRGQVVDPLADRALVILQHPGRDALHVDRLGNGQQIGLAEGVGGAVVNLRVVLGGGDETVALVEVRHCENLLVLGVECVVVVRVVTGLRSGRGHGLLVRTFRHRQDGGVDLGVEVVESVLRGLIETGQGQLDGLLLVSEDGERLADLLQAAGRDDVIQAALLEAQADGFRPLGEVLGELLVLAPVSLHLADDDAGFDGPVRVVLLKPVREAVKESLVHHARPDETVGLALALRVGRSHDIEPGSGLDELGHLLDEDALALKDGLQAHHALRPQVDLVQQEDGTALHGLHDRAVDELGFAVDEAEAADEIVLVRFRRDVHADALAGGVGADLFDHRGLAVAAHARDVDGGELLGCEDGGDVIVVAPRNEGVVLDGDERDIGGGSDEVESVAVHGDHSITSFGTCQVRGRRIRNIFFFLVIGCERGIPGFRNHVEATACATSLIGDKPRREDGVRCRVVRLHEGKCG